jgi:hypothetical protein
MAGSAPQFGDLGLKAVDPIAYRGELHRVNVHRFPPP